MARSLKVVFRSDIRGIAQAGDLKAVSPGYARNYLFPRNLAFPATASALRQWETERQALVTKAERKRADIQGVADKISGITLVLTAKAGQEGRLFGSIGRQEIVDALGREGVALDKRAVILPEPIKQLGAATATIHLSGAEASLKINVVAES